MRSSTAGFLCVLLMTAPIAAGQSQSIRQESGPGAVAEQAQRKAVLSLYAALTTLPRLEQRAAIRNRSPETRAELWRHNITSFINRMGYLTTEQEAFLDEAYAAVRPSIFDNSHCGTTCKIDRHAYLEFYSARAEALFDPEDIYRLFIRLGEEPVWPIHAADGAAEDRRAGEIRADTLRECDCSNYFECWFALEKCVIWECLPVQECGFWGTDGCSGVCA